MADTVADAVAALREGRLVAFPTETVYGLGADATSPGAVERIFSVKGRPRGHPLIVHLSDAGELGAWARDVPDAARLLADAWWPGPLTLVLRRAPGVADVVTGGRDTIGLRIPAHPLALDLLRQFGGGVAAPSANRFGNVSPTTAMHVRADLGDDVDVILDGGPCTVGVESTIVDCTGDTFEVLRPGGVTLAAIADVISGSGATVRAWEGRGEARAPGMLDAHYAPDARVVIVDGDAAKVVAVAEELAVAHGAVGVLAERALPDDGVRFVELEPAGDPEHYARVLYDRLRQADRLGLDVLVVQPPPPVGVGIAVRDRLRRAAYTPASYEGGAT